MVNYFEGKYKPDSGDRFALVVSRYNQHITEKLLTGAIETLSQNGVSEEQIDVFRVPGAWELSVAAKKLAASGGKGQQDPPYAAIICLGAVIRGETTHDQYINHQVSHSLGQIAIEHGIPVSFGLLTCNNTEQAIHRSGGNVGNKGIESAQAALEMVALFRVINDPTAE